MKIIYVQTYPVYHDLIDNNGFLAIKNRDKWMPMITKELGHESELWAVGDPPVETEWKFEDHPAVRIRIFKPDKRSGKSRHHTSNALNAAALNCNADHFVLKGVDGGVGCHLARKILIPSNIPYSMIIGGTWYHAIIRKAKWILYETEWQRHQLNNNNWLFWRYTVPDEKLIRLPKSVDTRHFMPNQGITKEFDIIGTGRLIPYFKNYEALFEMSRHLKVAVIGGGPLLEDFKRRYPGITWFGKVPHSEVPDLLNKGKLFFFPSLGEYFPRVLSEAAACGVPPVAFRNIIREDVIPPHIGLRVTKHNYVTEIINLVQNEKKLSAFSNSSRLHAKEHWGIFSSKKAIECMFPRELK